MKRVKLFLIPVAAAIFSNGFIWGGDVASHAVMFGFQNINEIDITGAPNLSINFATAGQQPQEITDSSSTYAITTNGSHKKILASINTAMPAYVTLKVMVATPWGNGVSKGYVVLGTASSEVATGITRTAANGLIISYKLNATVQAGVVPPDTRTVTFTLSD